MNVSKTNENLNITIFVHALHCIVIQKRQYIDTPKLCMYPYTSNVRMVVSKKS